MREQTLDRLRLLLWYVGLSVQVRMLRGCDSLLLNYMAVERVLLVVEAARPFFTASLVLSSSTLCIQKQSQTCIINRSVVCQTC